MVLGIHGIEESSTYQAIMAKGEVKGRAEGQARGRAEGWAKGYAEGWGKGFPEGWTEGWLAHSRQLLLELGTVRFGPPGPATITAIQAMTDADRIDDLSRHVLKATNWDDLVAPVALA